LLGFTQAWELFKITQKLFLNLVILIYVVVWFWINQTHFLANNSEYFEIVFFFLLSQLIESFIRRMARTYYIVLLFVIICEKLYRWHLPFKYPLINNFLNGTPLPGIVVIELRHHMVSPSPSAFVASSIFLEPKEQKCSALVLM